VISSERIIIALVVQLALDPVARVQLFKESDENNYLLFMVDNGLLASLIIISSNLSFNVFSSFQNED
jgi:hypothetical protein